MILSEKSCHRQLFSYGFHLKYKSIHYHKVACASGHHKQMKDLMASEIFVLTVKDRKLQSIDHTANSVDDTTGQQPSESRRA